MGMIPLKEYAERLGKNPVIVYQKAHNGGFTTARMIGRQWFIDEDEPYIDRRIRSGKYVGYKYGYQYQKSLRLKKEAAMQVAQEQETEETEKGLDESADPDSCSN